MLLLAAACLSSPDVVVDPNDRSHHQRQTSKFNCSSAAALTALVSLGLSESVGVAEFDKQARAYLSVGPEASVTPNDLSAFLEELGAETFPLPATPVSADVMVSPDTAVLVAHMWEWV